MTTTPIIPRGWRRLRTGEYPTKADKCWVCSYRDNITGREVWKFNQVTMTYWPVDSGETIIRRVRKNKSSSK